ncbi:hypothetical protein [Pedobacter caeni]|uniref:Tetratricopeptide repeat-containing protein n=1 Tax=Pedobacter caeni TaxID=288992 RepID=A0A1M4TI74_9SPHI|nr:hypothetical protein [Pedobacter caeni]SHE44202.1 hypothetical protein SAMN04488522_101205 [Pedobacter caeni]
MKRTLLFNFLFISIFNIGQAQEKYADIQSKVKTVVNSYSSADPNYKFLSTMLTGFEKSKKLSLSNFSKDNVGIAIVLSDPEAKLVVFPAKYRFDNDKINVSAIRSRSTGGLTEDMKEYVQKYLYKMEEVGRTKFFSVLLRNRPEVQGTFTQNPAEFIVNEPNSISFVRGDENWMYVISIDNQYKSQEKPRVIIYAFKISISGEDIFNTGNSVKEMEQRRITRVGEEKTDREKFPLFHDFRTDDIRQLLKELVQNESFKSNQELHKNIEKLDTKITRFNLKDYVPQFNYFLTLDFSTFKKKDQFEINELLNIQHLSAHALADYYLSQGNYGQAIDFYKKAAFDFRYEVSSGTTYIKDMERIIYDLSKTCYKAGRKDEAYGYLLGLIIDSQSNQELATKELKSYLSDEKENKKKFKSDLDRAMKTIKAGKNGYSRTFTFRNKEVFFYPMMAGSQAEYQQQMKNTEIYNYLTQ